MCWLLIQTLRWVVRNKRQHHHVNSGQHPSLLNLEHLQPEKLSAQSALPARRGTTATSVWKSRISNIHFNPLRSPLHYSSPLSLFHPSPLPALFCLFPFRRPLPCLSHFPLLPPNIELRSLGERCKLPEWDPRQSPSLAAKTFLCIVVGDQFRLLCCAFSRPYLSNGRAIVMVVVRLSVCSSVCHGYIVAKWCEIGPRLLLIIDRKLHMSFQMTWKSSTLEWITLKGTDNQYGRLS